jgi:NADPH:quinone reductase-like Zn-dependent oxidoreductase
MPWTRIRRNAFGGPENLDLETVADLPEPSEGEVRVRVLVTSAAFTDVMIRKGLYPEVRDKPPLTLGYDMVGIVDATGRGATLFKPGDRGADLTTIGAYGEYLCLPEDRLTKVPDGMTDVDALGMILSAVTPYQMLTRMANLHAGQSLLIHGAGGTVGTATLQLARDAGVASYGTDVAAKHDLIARLGTTPIDPRTRQPALLEATSGGVEAVFDPLGSDSLPRSLHALKTGGTLVAFGFQNEVLGRGVSIPVDLVELKLWDWMPDEHAAKFYSIGAMRRKHTERFRADLSTLLTMLAEGRIAPVVAEVVPLSDVRLAHEHVESAGVAGKLVMRVTEK